MIERSLVLLKPDSIQRGLMGKIIGRFEDAGLKIVAMKMVMVDKDLAKKHYKDMLIPIVGEKTRVDWDKMGVVCTDSVEEIGTMIVDKTREFMMSGPVVAMVMEGVNAVEVIRKIVGSTGPKDSPPGTIRGDYSHLSLGYASLKRKGAANMVHASGNLEEAKEEIDLWFKKKEMFDYKTVHEVHIFE